MRKLESWQITVDQAMQKIDGRDKIKITFYHFLSRSNFFYRYTSSSLKECTLISPGLFFIKYVWVSSYSFFPPVHALSFHKNDCNMKLYYTEWNRVFFLVLLLFINNITTDQSKSIQRWTLLLPTWYNFRVQKTIIFTKGHNVKCPCSDYILLFNTC